MHTIILVVWILYIISGVHSASITHTFDCSGNQCPNAYTIDNVAISTNQDIQCYPGDVLTFHINATGYPFALRVSPGGALFKKGVSGPQPSASGSITLTCGDFSTPIYYQSTTSASMVGKIYKPTGTPLTTNISAFLDPHNAERAFWGVPSLEWDPLLVQAAQATANDCAYNFLDPFSQRYAALQGQPFMGTINQLVGSNEGTNSLRQLLLVKNDWVCINNTCTNPTPNWCNIYRAIVWLATTKLGCATANCSNFGTIFFVCLYNPGQTTAHPFGSNFEAYCNHLVTPTPVPPGTTPTPPPIAGGPTPSSSSPVSNPSTSSPGTPSPASPSSGIPSPNSNPATPSPGSISPNPVSPTVPSPASTPDGISNPESPTSEPSFSSGLRGWEIGLIVLGVLLFVTIILSMLACKAAK